MRLLLAALLLAVALSVAACEESPSTGQINSACNSDGGAVYVHHSTDSNGNDVYTERCGDGRIVVVTS